MTTADAALDLPSLGIGEVEAWGWAWHGPVINGALQTAGGASIPVAGLGRWSGDVRVVRFASIPQHQPIPVEDGGELRSYGLISGGSIANQVFQVGGHPMQCLYEDPVSGRVIAWALRKIEGGVWSPTFKPFYCAWSIFGEFDTRPSYYVPPTGSRYLQTELSEVTGDVSQLVEKNYGLGQSLRILDSIPDGSRALYALEAVWQTGPWMPAVLSGWGPESDQRIIVAVFEALVSGSVEDGTFDISINPVRQFADVRGTATSTDGFAQLEIPAYHIYPIDCGGGVQGQQLVPYSYVMDYLSGWSRSVTGQVVSAWYADSGIRYATASYTAAGTGSAHYNRTMSGLGCGEGRLSDYRTLGYQQHVTWRWELVVDGQVADSVVSESSSSADVSTYHDEFKPSGDQDYQHWVGAESSTVLSEYAATDPVDMESQTFLSSVLTPFSGPSSPSPAPDLDTRAGLFLPRIASNADGGALYLRSFSSRCVGWIGGVRKVKDGPIIYKCRPIHTPAGLLAAVEVSNAAELPLFAAWQPVTGEVVRGTSYVSWV